MPRWEPGAREERDEEIYRLRKEGWVIEKLAWKYSLTTTRIIQILRLQEERHTGKRWGDDVL